jgi:hypothetical protein
MGGCREALDIQGGSNLTGTNCDLFTHNQSRSYLNHLVVWSVILKWSLKKYVATV